MRSTTWDMLRAGRFSEIFPKLRAEAKATPDPSHLTELGIAYLWAHNYSAAYEHFNDVNTQYPNLDSGWYGMAGVAKWCLNAREEAVIQWKEGIGCQFADNAGGVTLPLLLYFASAQDEKLFLRANARRILATRANKSRIRCWPGPVAQYVLSRIDESELRENCKARNDPETMERKWLADFYVGVVEKAKGNCIRYQEVMRLAARTEVPELREERNFTSRIWKEEFFLARHEADNSMAASNRMSDE